MISLPSVTVVTLLIFLENDENVRRCFDGISRLSPDPCFNIRRLPDKAHIWATKTTITAPWGTGISHVLTSVNTRIERSYLDFPRKGNVGELTKPTPNVP